MALRLMDSFDSNVVDELDVYPNSSNVSFRISGGRFPESVYEVDITNSNTGGDRGVIIEFDAQSTWIMAWFWSARNAPVILNGHGLCGVWDGIPPNSGGSGTQQVRLNVAQNGSIEARRGDGTLLGSSAAGVLSGDGTWYTIEAKFIIDNTSGSVVVKVNGTTVLNLTSIDTQNSANASADVIAFGWGTIDEIIVMDGTGTDNNDFIGEHRIETLRAVANGATNDFTPSAGANWENVDENPPDGDSTYNESNTVNHVDLYDVASMSLFTTGEAIEAVQVWSTVRKTSATARTVRNLLRSGTTNYEGTDKNPTENYDTKFFDIWEQDPDTAAAWTEAGVNAIQVGLKVQA